MICLKMKRKERESMSFKEYAEERIGRRIDLETEWNEPSVYDEWEEKYYQDYLDDMDIPF